MPRPGYGPSQSARAFHYLTTIDHFAKAMRLRVKTSPPRNWAVFWRAWSEEQLIMRQLQMRLMPPADNHRTRGQDWEPPFTPDEAA
jgi:hypothetical protein